MNSFGWSGDGSTSSGKSKQAVAQIISPDQPRWIGAAYNAESCGYVVGPVPSPGASAFEQQPANKCPRHKNVAGLSTQLNHSAANPGYLPPAEPSCWDWFRNSVTAFS